MNPFAIVPVNELNQAKSRLAGCLTHEGRQGLMWAMLEDVLSALKDLTTIVISPQDLGVRLRNRDITFLLQEGSRELDPAVRQANAYALKQGAGATLFIPGDMPLIKNHDVREILEIGLEYSAVITKATDGGTGVLYRRPPDVMESRFTANSFHDHLKEAEKKGVEIHVHDSFPLSLDVDTLEDIRTFMEYGSGTRTHGFLKECGY